MKRSLFLASIILISMALCFLWNGGPPALSGGMRDVDDERLLNADKDLDNWMIYGRSYDNQRYSPLDQINRENVTKLAPAWIYQAGVIGSQETSPLVVDGVMFVTTPFNHVVALDAATGQEIWKYEHQLRTKELCCGSLNRGAAVGYGKLYMITADARLITLDQKTGEIVWDVPMADPGASGRETKEVLEEKDVLKGATTIGWSGYAGNMAPLIYKGKVIVGVSGAGYGLHLERGEKGEGIAVVGIAGKQYGLRGFASAYDAQTGEMAWRWYSVPDKGWEGKWSEATPDGNKLPRDIEAEKAALEQYKDAWQRGGGSVWTTPALDPDMGLIFLGIGNPSPQLDDTVRPGDNLYTLSLVALDVESGKLKWYYQQIPHDIWGYDVASPPVLFDLESGGKAIKAVGAASKTGWFYVHNRETGEMILRSEPFVPQFNLFSRATPEGVSIAPGAAGGCSWSPVAFNPKTGAVYIPGMHIPITYKVSDVEPGKEHLGKRYTSLIKTPGAEEWGTFSAVDVKSGRIIWQRKMEKPMLGGALATGGGLVFTGEGNGHFYAMDDSTGDLLWKFQAGAGVNAPPITYQVDGVQYVAVAAGGNELFHFRLGSAIISFALSR